MTREVRHAGLVARRAQGRWQGVLIEGPSGAGKSDLALRLVAAGFRLVADDRVIVWSDSRRLFGRAPLPLRDQIEVRGLGIVAAPAIDLAEIELLVIQGSPERLPDPAVQTVCDVPIPCLKVTFLHPSAPMKVCRALTAFDAAHKRRI
jgi:serine kinase of HPr protein (carbohydrate metabolism regulator)